MNCSSTAKEKNYSAAVDRKYQHLTREQVSHFMAHGFIRLESCFSRQKASEWTSTLWQRLGMDPNDKRTWTRERIHMPTHRNEPVSAFAPKAWAAICELLGGKERIATHSGTWGDGFIVNLGTPEWESKRAPPEPKQLNGWHVDGDFFVHFLDSKEQALLVIPLFEDIAPTGGGTMVCPDAISVIAKHLYDHPEGVSPGMMPRGQQPKHGGLSFYAKAVQQCHEFHEMTGNVGDVILMHPLMVHSASHNILRTPRIITNPPVSLKEPFNFDRERTEDYSLVELKTLRALGKERLRGWKIVGEREALVPDAWKVKEEMKRLENERLKKMKEVGA